MTNSNNTCWDTFDAVLKSGVDRVILYGPPGTGKTYSALYENIGEDQESFRITCTDDMTNMEVTGGFLPSADGGFDYIEGSAIKAWAGHRLVIDEIDKAGGDVFATLLNMTDSEGSSRWEHPVTGEVFKPQRNFSVIMTTNVEQIEELPSALTDRVPVRIRIDRPHPSALDMFPRAWRGYVDRMADAGSERMSLRLFQSLHQLSQHLSIEEASQLVLGPRADSFLEAIRIDNFGADNL